jgi:hypothetical protein
MSGTSYTTELHNEFTNVEAKVFILRTKNKDTGYDEIPAKVWKVFCTVTVHYN